MPKVGQKVNRKPTPVFESSAPALAVNIADLTRLHPSIRQMILQGRIDPKAAPIRTDRERPDEAAVELRGDLVTVASIVDILREHDGRAGEYPIRAYIRRGKTWTKLPGNATLTLVLNNDVVLNPEHFPNEAKL